MSSTVKVKCKKWFLRTPVLALYMSVQCTTIFGVTERWRPMRQLLTSTGRDWVYWNWSFGMLIGHDNFSLWIPGRKLIMVVFGMIRTDKARNSWSNIMKHLYRNASAFFFQYWHEYSTINGDKQSSRQRVKSQCLWQTYAELYDLRRWTASTRPVNLREASLFYR